MNQKIKKFFKDKKTWQSVVGFLIVSLFVVASVGVNSAWAKFYRTQGSTSGFSYGYGYGYDSGYGYGYGYYDSSPDYGFLGKDGKATGVSVSTDGLTVSYTTSYKAKNRIEYGTDSSSLNSYNPSSDWSAISYEAKGSHSITLTGLDASLTYYYRVATRDAGGKVWYSAIVDKSGSISVTSSAVSSTASPNVSGYTGSVDDAFTSLGVSASAFSKATLDAGVDSPSISVTGLTGTVAMDIPAGTNVYSSSGSFTSIPVPTVDTSYTSSSTLTANGTDYNPIGKVVEFGIPGVSLIFDKLVTVTIPDVDQTPAKVIYSVDGTTWHAINYCDSSDTSATTPAPSFPGACFGYDSSADLITLKTYHFSKFAAAGTAPVSTAGGVSLGDITAPTISDIKITAGGASATISWQTNESSWSWIVYGTTTAYGLEEKTSSYVKTHSLTLTGLSSETDYHFQIKSRDLAGNIGSSADQTFTTLTEGEEEKEVVAKPISEMTLAELQAKIKEIIQQIIEILTKLISAIQAKIAELAGVEETPAEAPAVAVTTLTKDLRYGDRNDDVKLLQTLLAKDTDVYPEGLVTGYFGSLTKAAVIKFQEKYASDILTPLGLSEGTGYVGPTTRAKLNSLLGQ